MNSLWIGIIGGLVRLLLLPVTNWLVGHGVISDDQTTQVFADVTAFAIGAAWVVWNKLKERKILNVALASEKPTTLQDVKQSIAGGKTVSPLTPEHVVPTITDKGQEK